MTDSTIPAWGKRLMPFLLLAAVLLAAGCLQPVQELGCCLKDWTTPGPDGTTITHSVYDEGGRCMLYELNGSEVDDTLITSGCNETSGFCTVMISTQYTNGGWSQQATQIPVCTEEENVGCINGNCTAMVCGDFTFTPRVAPAFPDSEADSSNPEEALDEEAPNAIPAGSQGSTAIQFYKAQCRFLPMDATLSNIMKNSNSALNVFRMGVGGSFDEFDQYQYYFPISDRYCGLNAGGYIDRYMNYLTLNSSGDVVPYSPTTGITSNCVDDDNGTVPAPLAFAENDNLKSSTYILPNQTTVSSFSFYQPVPEVENYKFADEARFDNYSDEHSAADWFESTYLEPMNTPPQSCAFSVSGTATGNDLGGTTYSGFNCRDNTTGDLCPTGEEVEDGIPDNCINYAAPCAFSDIPPQGDYTYGYLCVNSSGETCPSGGCINQSAPCTNSVTSGDSPYLCIDAHGDACPVSGGSCSGNESTGYQTSGYEYSDCIEAYADCTDPNTEHECTQTWMSGTNGNYLNTTCWTDTQSHNGGTCEQALAHCVDNVSMGIHGYDDQTMSCVPNTALGQQDYGGGAIPYDNGPSPCYYNAPGPAGYYTYDKPAPVNVFKQIDTGYYSRELSIMYADSIYDLSETGTAQAPFECDVAADDCYSGTCNTQVYSRGVMLTSSNPQTAQEVVTDCSQFTDSAGINEVVCAPTESVTAEGQNPPERDYGSVSIIPSRVEFLTTNFKNGNQPDAPVGVNGLIDGTELDSDWATIYNTTPGQVGTPNGIILNENIFSLDYSVDVTNVTQVSWIPQTEFKYCPAFDVEYVNSSGVQLSLLNPDNPADTASTNEVWCPNVTQSTEGPPLGGVVFFGKTGTDGSTPVTYNGDTIIGYSLLDQADFQNTLLYKNCNLQPGDYETITLSGPRDPQINATGGLLDAFRPYFEQRVKGFGMSMGTTKANAYSVVFSFTPWIATFEKGTQRVASGGGSYSPQPNVVVDAGNQVSNPDESDGPEFTWLGDFLASPPAQEIRQHNTYDEEMDQVPGTTTADLDDSSDPWAGAEYSNNANGKEVYHTYDLGFSQYITLIKYDPSSGMLGNCAIDNSTYLPVMRNFGWCDPCTASTLAFQNITANTTPYLPRYTAELMPNGTGYNATNMQSICTSALTGSPTTDNATCSNPGITDMNDYTGSLGAQGAPRTEPDATILKERIGNYMKSGVLPVLDISNDSNWNLTKPLGSSGVESDYTGYDFQPLFGTMGAAVVIVDRVASAADATAKEGEIINRSETVREDCADCLVAIHVDSPASNESFASAAAAALSDPRASLDVDMVTFDYDVTDHPQDGATGLVNKSQAVVNDLASYGYALLNQTGKPSMVIGFSVDSDDPDWSGTNPDGSSGYSMLFDAIAQGQESLVKAGITGIIYSPVRTVIGSAAATTSGPFLCTAPIIYSDPGGLYAAAAADVQASFPIPACPSSASCATNFLYVDVCNGIPCSGSSLAAETTPSIKAEYGLSDCPADESAIGCKTVGLENCTLPANPETAPTAENGLVDTSTGVGVTTDKFCALEKATQLVTATAPVAIFSQEPAQSPVQCTACSQEDINTGSCNASDSATVPNQLLCDDGNPCEVCDANGENCEVPTAANGYTPTDWRCPAGAVTGGCMPCADAPAGETYSCNYDYSNGSTQTETGGVDTLTTDAYSDIIAALPKPYKCCLSASDGSNYSYSEQPYQVPLSQPVVFSKTGNPNAQCGSTGLADLTTAQSFCGYTLPVEQYDISCNVTVHEGN